MTNKPAWAYNPFRATLSYKDKVFAIVTPNGRDALKEEDSKMLLTALNGEGQDAVADPQHDGASKYEEPPYTLTPSPCLEAPDMSFFTALSPHSSLFKADEAARKEAAGRTVDVKALAEEIADVLWTPGQEVLVPKLKAMNVQQVEAILNKHLKVTKKPKSEKDLGMRLP